MTLNLARLGLVFLVALPIGANAETADLPLLPKRNPLRTPAGTADKSVLPGDQPTVPWTEAEIADAAAKCKKLLTGDPLDYDLQARLRSVYESLTTQIRGAQQIRRPP